MVKQIVIGLIVASIGGATVYFSGYLYEAFGSIARFDKHFGSTRNGYALFGFLILVIGFLLLFGVIPTSSPTENLGGFTTSPVQ